MHRRRLTFAAAVALVAVAALGGRAAAGPLEGTRTTVEHTAAPAFTPAELTAQPAGNWITAGGNIRNQRYSPLNQINTTNASGLRQAWKTNLDGSGKAAKYSQEATPIVYNGVMYIPTGNNDIFALDATNGQHLWKYESKITQKNNTICCGWLSRGLGFG